MPPGWGQKLHLRVSFHYPVSRKLPLLAGQASHCTIPELSLMAFRNTTSKCVQLWRADGLVGTALHIYSSYSAVLVMFRSGLDSQCDTKKMELSDKTGSQKITLLQSSLLEELFPVLVKTSSWSRFGAFTINNSILYITAILLKLLSISKEVLFSHQSCIDNLLHKGLGWSIRSTGEICSSSSSQGQNRPISHFLTWVWISFRSS